MIMNTSEGTSNSKFDKSVYRHLSITILNSDWVNNNCTKSVLGMTSDMTVIVNPNDESSSSYYNSIVRVTTQSVDSLTFTCDTVPTENITLDILMVDAELVGGGLDRLDVTGNLVVQTLNEEVNLSGVTIKAIYKDGSELSVNPTGLLPTIWTAAGTQTLTISYTEGGVTKTITRTVNVVDPLTIPLTLQADATGSISITKTGDPGTIYYSVNDVDKGELANNYPINVSVGDRVSFYRTLSGNLSLSDYFRINCTVNCYIYGNIMSIYNKDNFSNLTTISYSYAFHHLFAYNAYIDINLSIGKLVLPATTLDSCCYTSMFYNCTNLTTSPVLPATDLDEYCYSNIFYGCKNLMNTPELPATTLADYCYSYMFGDCTNLTVSPELPATTLARGCYSYMFAKCSGLTVAPELPATTLAIDCYKFMFGKCTNLTTSPILHATTLVSSCYEDMLYDCTNLNSITCLATDISASNCTNNWVDGVAASGTFTKAPGTNWTIGASGIPSGWTVVGNPTSLTIGGDWSNPQYEGQAPDLTGLTFTVNYDDSTSVTKIVSQLTISPSIWSTGVGNQTATFSYTESGMTVSASKSTNMTYTVTIQSNDTSKGTVTGSTTYQYISSAQTKSVTNSPATACALSSWSISGLTSGSASISGDTLTISAGSCGDIIATANFYIKALNNCSWSEIRTIADTGNAAQYWSVGDYKEVSVAAGTVDKMSVVAGTYRAVIIGINHNPTYENPKSIDFAIGQNTSGTDICFYNSTGVRVNPGSGIFDITDGGWVGSEMYLAYLPQFYNLLSGNTGLQNAMIAPKKYTHNYEGGSDNQTEANVTLSENANYKMFLMAEYEVFGSRYYANSYEQNKQMQYAYYSSSGLAKSTLRYRSDTGEIVGWWVRSTLCSSSNSSKFCSVTSEGLNGSLGTSKNRGLVPCFRV